MTLSMESVLSSFVALLLPFHENRFRKKMFIYLVYINGVFTVHQNCRQWVIMGSKWYALCSHKVLRVETGTEKFY